MKNNENGYFRDSYPRTFFAYTNVLLVLNTFVKKSAVRFGVSLIQKSA